MANIDDLKEKVISLVDEISPRAIEMAEHIFDDPELSQKEFKAQKYLTQELKKNGFKVEERIGGIETSFRAEFDSKKEGPAIALVAEYDALPKMGHACHHHIIASSSVNCAIALSKISDELCGKIICNGQNSG